MVYIKNMENKTTTMTDFLTREQRLWLQDSYIECECELNNGDCEPDLIEDNLEHMDDDELIEECVAFMPEILRDFEIQFGERIAMVAA